MIANRTVLHSKYALVSPQSHVTSNLPGCVNTAATVLVSAAMGARFSQVLYKMASNGSISYKSGCEECFFYVIKGTCTFDSDTSTRHINQESFFYIPPGTGLEIKSSGETCVLLAFFKNYEFLEGATPPEVYFGSMAQSKQEPFGGDESIRLCTLLPDDMRFDMAVNILIYQPGRYLPITESHVMEHGLYMLKGEGIFLLNKRYYRVTQGDTIWMAPYCPQWFAALGHEAASYLYYKDVNRYPDAG